MIDIENKKVLIIEFSTETLRSLNIFIQMSGGKTIIARSVANAASIAMTETPDIVLMNSALPNGDTERILKRLRSAAHTRSIPVLILVENSLPFKVFAAKNANQISYLRGSFDSDSLIAALDNSLQQNLSNKSDTLYRQDVAA